MDELVKIALVGTGKQSADPPADGPAGELARAAASDDRERRLLLQAGAEAVYALAGFEPAANLAAPEPVEGEDRPACPPQTEHLLHTMLSGEMSELLPELLDRMARARLVLPPAVLPPALETTAPVLQSALRPVLGRRGQWLSRFNPAWAWATALPTDKEAVSPEALRTAWEEGDLPTRREALAAMRRLDADEARRWLEEAWKTEKAENRARLLNALETSLSLNDEPYLESVLDDRSATVRPAAMALLAILPQSQYAQRMKARADAMLQTTKAGLLRKRAKLECAPPEELDKEAARDVVAKPPQGTGKRAWWALQTLSVVPPSHWEARLDLKPADIVAAAESDDYAGALVEGWTLAALRFPESSQEWFPTLWDCWYRAYTKQADGVTQTASEMLQRILAALPQAEAESRLLSRIEISVGNDDAAFSDFTEALPAPWSVKFARSYLRALREGFRSDLGQNSFTWARGLPVAGRALPQACFDDALEEWEVSDRIPWQGICLREIGRMQEIVRARKICFEEIPL